MKNLINCKLLALIILTSLFLSFGLINNDKSFSAENETVKKIEKKIDLPKEITVNEFENVIIKKLKDESKLISQYYKKVKKDEKSEIYVLTGTPTNDVANQIKKLILKAKDISKLWAIPFVLILLSIAIFPLFAPHFWHHNYWKVSLFVFAFPMIILSAIFYDSVGFNVLIQESTIHEFLTYVSFILLLASLFTISGAIMIRGTMVGTPLLNTIILLIGAILASFMATTGASMLLIRPLIRANKFRSKKVHVIIFFIFIVSNIGGLLTPLGDPPLFLGYLKGVPFTWTLFNLVPEWLFANVVLIALFFLIDTIIYKKELKKGLIKVDDSSVAKEPIRINGKVQFIFLFGVVFSIYLQGLLYKTYSWWPHFGPQEGAMFLMMILSLIVAKPKSKIRVDNEFSWFPIKEVAALFAAIFACMVPTLFLLNLHGGELGVTQPWQFFWVTGGLSSFLDNAPTYLVFLETAQPVLGVQDVLGILNHQNGPGLLAAISCGAVFMGANSYIGNAPNFMVKSIAEEQGIKMPSFFGYMIYSVIILIPLFILITFIFFK
ncbi:MAG: sodium:proton antiporter [Spirochaetota bacterium]|nr:sodium:proton antiporter [Spirochaetota bacterium]